MFPLDEYERKARLLPALLASMPVAIVIVAVGLSANAVVTLLLSFFTGLGGSFALATVARQQGQKVQQRLYSQWGGPPTTQLLRLGEDGDAERHERRSRLEDLLGVRLSSLEEEVRDPVAADHIYGSAVTQLREKTRDRQRFPLVFAENCTYGFTRNLLGLRPLALPIASICTCLVLTMLLWQVFLSQLGVSTANLAIALAADLSFSALWIYYPTEDRLKRAAQTYAERLLDSIYALAAATTRR